MKKTSHQVFVLFLGLITIAAVIALSANGLSYYLTPLAERPFRTDYSIMKPSGTYSQGLGIFGSLMIAVGVASYMMRKRMSRLSRYGRLSGWLTFHDPIGDGGRELPRRPGPLHHVERGIFPRKPR